MHALLPCISRPFLQVRALRAEIYTQQNRDTVRYKLESPISRVRNSNANRTAVDNGECAVWGS